MNVLVTDGDSRSALAATRSLGRKGCRIVVAGQHQRSLAAASRYCHSAAQVTDPLIDGRQFVADVQSIIGREKIDVIFPMTEQSINELNRIRDMIEEAGVVLACATAVKMQAVSDKFRLFQRAIELDVPMPKTVFISNPAEFEKKADLIQEFPVVIKPSLSRLWDGKAYLSTRVMYAQDADQLADLYQSQKALEYPSMIQERIVGPGTGLFTLFANKRHQALFSHQRLREKPPSGGVSVVCQSVPLDQDMVDAAKKLLAEVDWSGVAMVEFKRDSRDGRAKLMEINGRFWGSLQLAVAAGVDFPGLYFDFLLGDDAFETPKNYRYDHRMKWFYGTLDHLLIRLKKNSQQLNLPPDYPSKWETLCEFFHLGGRNSSFDVLDRRDPGPFILETRQYFRDLLGFNR